MGRRSCHGYTNASISDLHPAILVTGAAGFIGSAVARYLIAKTDASMSISSPMRAILITSCLSTIIPATVSNPGRAPRVTRQGCR